MFNFSIDMRNYKYIHITMDNYSRIIFDKTIEFCIFHTLICRVSQDNNIIFLRLLPSLTFTTR